MTLTARKKQQRSTRTQAALAQLQTLFPAAFPHEDAQIRPLSIGLRDDLKAWLAQHPPPNPAGMIGALQHHCSRDTYQRTIIAGAMRINLHGEPVEPVTPEGQAHAEQRLARNQAERQATAQRKAVKLPPSTQPAMKKGAKPKTKPRPPIPAVSAPPAKPPLPTVIVKKRRIIPKPE